MNLFNLRSGKQLDGPVAVVSDLDKMIAEPIAFRLHGKVHKIKPVSVSEFFKYTNALAALTRLKDKDAFTANDILVRYYDLIAAVCDTITYKDVEQMTHAQIAALFSIVIEAVTGKAHASNDEDEKKNLKMLIPG